jgi:endonuclease G
MENRIQSILSNRDVRQRVQKSGRLKEVDLEALARPEFAQPLVRRGMAVQTAGFDQGDLRVAPVAPPVEEAAPAAAPGAPAAPPPIFVNANEEAIVLLENRPSLLVRNDRFEIPRGGEWAGPLAAGRSLLEARLPSIGRIEVDDGSGARPFGTAWVIGERLLATNRHVAETFCMQQGARFVFLKSFIGREYRTRVDFREEYGAREEEEVPVEAVVFMEGPDRQLPDVALLRLADHASLPDPIPLLEGELQPRSAIAVVGYPAFDPRYGLDGLEAARSVFGTIYDVKRLSPGYIMDPAAGPWYFSHDATTLGGNSGSVLLDVATGYAVGMHFRGEFRRANYAVSAKTILEYAAKSAIAVRPRRPLPKRPAAVPEAAIEEAPAASYANRDGYRADFLGAANAVALPALTDRTQPDVFKPVQPHGVDGHILKYTHFSVAINRRRRMCMFSAVNIDGKNAVALKGQRPGWRFDSRVPRNFQVKDECYGKEEEGKFSRGHMTRREDPNWGQLAVQANADTFHVTNACPQMQPFNAGIWLGLEDYALQNAKQDDMKISVFTGPVFKDSSDPDYFGVKVPVWFWKVIAFIHDQTGALTATGYKMSQRNTLPGEEFVYGRYETYQTSLREIEGLSGLSFGALTNLDPFRIVDEAPPVPITSFEQIRFA